MTDKIREVLNILDQENISYEILEHPPVYTIGEVLDAGLPKEEVIAKNLFVRDDRKDQYMLLVVPGDRRVNLKAFRRAMGTRPLSFASGEELSRILGLSKGAVSPLEFSTIASGGSGSLCIRCLPEGGSACIPTTIPPPYGWPPPIWWRCWKSTAAGCR